MSGKFFVRQRRRHQGVVLGVVMRHHQQRLVPGASPASAASGGP
jgi:hypothetical protein